MLSNLALHDLGSDGLALVTKHLHDYDVLTLATTSKQICGMLKENLSLPNKGCRTPGPLIHMEEEEGVYTWHGCYRDGRRHGSWSKRSPDNEVVQYVEYLDGVFHGINIQFKHPRHMVKYVRGVPEGQFDIEQPDHTVKRGVYRGGLIEGYVMTIKQRLYLTRADHYSGGMLHGVCTTFHPKYKVEEHYCDGMRHGTTTYWRLSDEPKIVIQSNMERQYHEPKYIQKMRPLKFAPSKVEHYNNGVPCGKWIWMRKDGSIKKCRLYENGQIVEQSCEYIE